jgi:hypothetical protein
MGHNRRLSDGNDVVENQSSTNLSENAAHKLGCWRPLLTHLNADTSWLLSVPVPDNGSYEQNNRDKLKREPQVDGGHKIDSGKKYVHILIDPWFRGSQSDVAKFFSQQWHSSESAVQTIADVEERIATIEEIPPDPSHSGSSIDVVVVSHEFTDHMHKETLLEISAAVPVFAPLKAASIIRSWRHFDVVVSMPTDFAKKKDWRSISVPPLPPWLGVTRLGQDRIDLLYYHSAVMITFPTIGSGNWVEGTEGEAVIYTPHGITTVDLKPVEAADPPIRTLALLHGLHDISIGGQLNLGAHNGLKVQRLTKAKYWVGTHDEVKPGGGLVSWFLKRKVLSVKEAMEKEIRKGETGMSLEDVHFVDLGNGESLILD